MESLESTAKPSPKRRGRSSEIYTSKFLTHTFSLCSCRPHAYDVMLRAAISNYLTTKH